MKRYILLYGDKKPEDNICITNMFGNCKKINLGWTESDFKYNMKIVDNAINEEIEQIIFSGFEIGWNKLIIETNKKYPNIPIKVICNTQDSLLYYEYERENFFKLLELSKENIVQDIAFFRKGQYETYKKLGYKCSYIKENYILDEKNKKQHEIHENIELGIYPLNYTWDKNIFNQLCVAKFVENCHLSYNSLDPRMEEFLTTMEISSTPDKLEKIDEKCLIQSLSKNDAIISTSFTEYVHPVFLISMELGIPCLIGNNSDFFENGEELQKYVVTMVEDNAIINSKMVEIMVKEKDKIIELYKVWKDNYNKEANEQLEKFLKK